MPLTAQQNQFALNSEKPPARPESSAQLATAPKSDAPANLRWLSVAMPQEIFHSFPGVVAGLISACRCRHGWLLTAGVLRYAMSAPHRCTPHGMDVVAGLNQARNF
jgi:hypothetical protein